MATGRDKKCQRSCDVLSLTLSYTSRCCGRSRSGFCHGSDHHHDANGKDEKEGNVSGRLIPSKGNGSVLLVVAGIDDDVHVCPTKARRLAMQTLLLLLCVCVHV